MPISADDLLSAPPGRRLLLEFALVSEASREEAEVATELPLWKAVFDTQVASPDAVVPRGWGADHIPRTTSATELARLLDRVVLARATSGLVEQLTTRMQQSGPDEGDRLAGLLASASMDAALARVARHLLARRHGKPVRQQLRALLDGQDSP